jgi:hypothetical protein
MSDAISASELSENRLWWWGPAVVVLLIAAMAPWYFYSPDDLFIHLRFADNLVEHGEWAFNPGEPSAGATSPPWVLALALLLALGLPGVAAAKGLASLTAAALVLLVAKSCRGAGAAPALAALATVCVVGSHWLRLWSAAGMETPLPPLLLLAGMTTALAARPRPLLAGVLLGLATCARPDSVGAFVVLCLLLSWHLKRNDRVRLLVAAVISALLWPLTSRLLLGTWLPLTMLAKGGIGLEQEQLAPALLRTVTVAGSEMLPLLLLAAVAVVLDPAVRRRWKIWVAPMAVALTFPAGYLLNQASGGVAATGRYLTPWFVFTAIAAVMILAPWWHERKRHRWVIAAAALTLIQSAALTFIHAPATQRYEDYQRRSLLTAANWLRQNAGPDDQVAAGDIGVLGYVGEIDVLDIAGIVNPEAHEWSRNHTTFEGLQKHRPRFFINPGWYPGFNLRRLDPYTVETVFTHHHVSYRWSLEPAEMEVTLRVLDWQEKGLE